MNPKPHRTLYDPHDGPLPPPPDPRLAGYALLAILALVAAAVLIGLSR